MPRVLGLTAEKAQEELRRRNLQPAEVGQAPHDVIPAGSVIWQDPPPETIVPELTDVDLIVSSGPQAVVVPDVTNLDFRLARRIIRAAGLTIGRVDSIQVPAPKGVAVQTRPAAGMALEPGATIDVVVSRGEPTITVPHVVGLVLNDAQTMIEEAGLIVGSYWERTEVTGTPGTIAEQRPPGGTLAAPGTSVELIIARRQTQ